MKICDRVIDIFKALAQVPRQSKHEEKVSAWLVERAQKHGFDVERDDANNVFIRVPATPGYEHAPILILQGHMDMVCEKTPGSSHNFDTDPIDVIIEDGWMHANQTSLGADDGLGVALALAMAEDPDIEHPALEIFITSDEETGMTGASALRPEQLKGRILLNLDSEDEGIFTVGCAGGRETKATLTLQKTTVTPGTRVVAIHIGGLLGGHSGCEIDKGRASAIKLSARLISNIMADVRDVCLVDFSAGSAHNAIPRNADLVLAVPAQDEKRVTDILDRMARVFASEFKATDPGIAISHVESDCTAQNVYKTDSLRTLCDLLLCYPHGVASMNHEVAGLVETSDNLASLSIEIEKDTVHLLSSQRSSVMSKLNALTARIEACIRLAGGEFQSSKGYPGWAPDMESDLLRRCVATYEARFGHKPVVNVIHAGLECGIIGAKIPDMQMISFGPTVVSPHSPQERAEIATIQKVADFLIDLLKSYK